LSASAMGREDAHALKAADATSMRNPYFMS
jgi:hypothetical protein